MCIRDSDVAAPSNYDVATALDRTQTGQWGQYRWFSGTSGAAPHVGGAAALLRQARPDLNAEQIKAAPGAGARPASFTRAQANEGLWSGQGGVGGGGPRPGAGPFSPIPAPENRLRLGRRRFL